MRHLNANKELNATEIVADEENEVAVDEKIIVSLTNKRKKKKNILKPEPKVLDMEEKRNVREQMFRLLDESRIEEMRLVLQYIHIFISAHAQSLRNLKLKMRRKITT